MYLPTLNDEELLRYAESTQNAITSTDLEIELVKRMAALLDDQGDDRLAPLDEIDASAEDVRAVVDALIENCTTSAEYLRAIGDTDIESPKELKAMLELANKFHEYSEEHSIAVTELNNLISLTH